MITRNHRCRLASATVGIASFHRCMPVPSDPTAPSGHLGPAAVMVSVDQMLWEAEFVKLMLWPKMITGPVSTNIAGWKIHHLSRYISYSRWTFFPASYVCFPEGRSLVGGSSEKKPKTVPKTHGHRWEDTPKIMGRLGKGKSSVIPL